MDPITGMMFSQREVNHISNYVWETMKRIGASLEAKDDDSDNDLLYTPLGSPFEPISTKLEA
jgi:hypothetical protein